MDRLTRLPVELLCQILSFLPTKSAVVTSSLSEAWRNLWKVNPNLDIDDSVFINPQDGKGEREETRQSFISFVDNVLARQGDSPINNFSLKCITGIPPDTINRWICNVLKRGVSDLFINVNEYEYDLPRELFFSRKLKLRNEQCVEWLEEPFSLPMLKSLHIDSDLISCGEIDKFIPSFPVLEELRMDSVDWPEPDVTVSSATLTTLSLHVTGCKYYVNPKSVSFDNPNLLVLSYYDLVAQDYPLVNMEKLHHAEINLIVTEKQVRRLRELLENGDGDEEENVFVHFVNEVNHMNGIQNDDEDEDEVDDEKNVVVDFRNVVKLMNGIQNVQILSVTADTLYVLSQCCDTLPVFNNLKFLGISSKEDRGWQAMPALLKNCPHLETIILEGLSHCVTDKCGDACPCISREDKGSSLRSCPVNRMKIQGFRATMKEMTMIQHFLDYFPNLRKLDVFVIVEDNDEHTQLRNPEMPKSITEMFELYKKLYPSCSVKLTVSPFLQKKSRAQGHI